MLALGSRSYIPPSRPPPPPAAITNPLPNSKVPSSPQNRVSSKKSSTQPRQTNKSSTTTTKGNKIKTSSNSVVATSGATTKRSNNDIKKYRSKTNNQRSNQTMLMSTGLTLKPPLRNPTPPISTNKKPVKSVTDAVISYLHYKGASGVEHSTGRQNHRELLITHEFA